MTTAATLTPSFDPPLRACRLCGSASIGRHDRDYRGITIDRCSRCGVAFMNPQYTDEYLAEYYAGYMGDFERIQDPARYARRAKAKNEHIAQIEHYTSVGRFFAVGAGDGLEMQIARRRGWDVVGFDVDAETTRQVAELTGDPVWCGDLFAMGIEDSSFDAIFLDQVIEHPKNPEEYLRLCHRILRPDGVLYLGCPNIRSLSSALKTVIGRVGLKKQRGKHYDTWHHLFYYSPESLRFLLESVYDYEVLVLEGDPKPPPPRDASARLAVVNVLKTRFPVLDSAMRALVRPLRKT
ncbi:MAG: methyltransferase domain-containing protein [Gemmatimonadaceae bacterium]